MNDIRPSPPGSQSPSPQSADGPEPDNEKHCDPWQASPKGCGLDPSSDQNKTTSPPSYKERAASTQSSKSARPGTSTTENDARRNVQPSTQQHYAPQTGAKSYITLLWLPAFCIVVPMLAVASGLLFIVIKYRVRRQPPSLSHTPSAAVYKSGYLLVHYSSTRLLFISSMASTWAPYLGACTMALWMFQVGHRFLRSSSKSDISELPCSRDYSHLLGLASASIEKLCIYISYAWKSKRSRPRLLRRSAWVLVASLTLIGAIIVSDTVLHYETDTVPFSLLVSPLSIGKRSWRLLEAALSFDRNKNNGLPFSRNFLLYGEDPTAYTKQHDEIFYSHHNVSTHSTIRLIPTSNNGTGLKIAVLLPYLSSIPAMLDFRAQTVGAITSCRFVTKDCSFRPNGQHNEYSAFNCSPEFWGVIGSTSPELLYADQPLDPNLPPKCFKPSSTMQFGFFEDENLQRVYDTIGLNASGWWSDTPSNTKLTNAVYVGVAAGFGSATHSAGIDYENDSRIYSGSLGYLSFALSCKYETYDVWYTWSNGTIQDVVTSPSPNGTLSEMWHGYHLPHQNSLLDFDLQNAVAEAVLQPDLDSFLRTWSDLYSAQIMSVIGAFMVPDLSVAEQVREAILVSRVPIAPLALLVAFCVGYAILGIVLTSMAIRTAARDTFGIVDMLSIDGLSEYAFEKSIPSMMSSSVQPSTLKRQAVYVAADNEKSKEEGKIKIVEEPKGYGYVVV